MNNMTALVSCFARAYHHKNSQAPVFPDHMAGALLTDEEYQSISENMAGGIAFFAPDFQGTREEALRLIVEGTLAPSVLGRSAFCQRALENAHRLGCGQYVIFAAGYDSFSLRCAWPELHVYQLDRPEMLADKRQRMARGALRETCPTCYVPCDLSEESWPELLCASGFKREQLAFGSLLGISYYLKPEDFSALLRRIASLWREGGAILFDYPAEEVGRESGQTRALAQAAGEGMQARYSYEELEESLQRAGFLIYEHLTAEEMTAQFFSSRGSAMKAPEGVNYCLAVLK